MSDSAQQIFDKMDRKLATIENNVALMIQYIAKLEKENQDFLDTFEAIYTKLGLTEANVNGKELVSVTVKRRIDEIMNQYNELRFRMDQLEK